MNKNRIVEHPVLGTLKKQTEITFTFDGKQYKGYEGDTIASALMANGIFTVRVHENSKSPRGIYCNIGHCYECRLIVNGQANVRSCVTELKENMELESGRHL